MQPASSSTISPGHSASQVMIIDNPSQAVIKLRIKISFHSVEGKIDEVIDFMGFDESLWA